MPKGSFRDVMDVQADILAMWNTQWGRNYTIGFGESLDRKRSWWREGEVYGAEQIDDSEKYRARSTASGVSLVASEKMKIRQADPIYITDEIMDLWEIAQETFDPEPLVPSDMFTESGLLLLPRPMFVHDRHNKLCSYRIIAWMPAIEEGGGESGISISTYANDEDRDDYFDDERIDEMRAIKRSRGSRCEYSLSHITPWWFNDEEFPSRMPELTRQVKSLFRLCQQTIVGHEYIRPDRPSVRRAKRLGLATSITLITLRRMRHTATGEEGTIEWSCRWLVRGHWRNQWYPSLKTHRQVWISPHVKGPEDKELRLTQRVFELRR